MTNRILKTTIGAAVAALLAFTLSPYLGAQTFTHNTTTLAADQAAADTTISLTSVSAATGSSFGAVQAGQFVLVGGELEQFVSVTATNTIWNVQRRGARTIHRSGQPVYIGPAGSFQSADPPPGGCVTANQPKFWINVGAAGAAGPSLANQSGRIFTCGGNSVWALGTPPFDVPFLSGAGAAVTLTAAQSGQTLLFDRAAGIVYTLPAPFPGMMFDFIITTTITSNSAEVATATPASQFIQGTVLGAVAGAASNAAANLTGWQCNGTSHVAVKMNGTTTGGILGSWFRLHAVSTTVWQVEGLAIQSGTIATPCSTTV